MKLRSARQFFSFFRCIIFFLDDLVEVEVFLWSCALSLSPSYTHSLSLSGGWFAEQFLILNTFLIRCCFLCSQLFLVVHFYRIISSALGQNSMPLHSILFLAWANALYGLVKMNESETTKRKMMKEKRAQDGDRNNSRRKRWERGRQQKKCSQSLVNTKLCNVCLWWGINCREGRKQTLFMALFFLLLLLPASSSSFSCSFPFRVAICGFTVYVYISTLFSIGAMQ